MAQTRKRRRKHRGTQAGTIEARGRTSRPQPGSARQAPQRRGGTARPNRYDTEPTWKASAKRAIIPAVIFAVLAAVLFKQPAVAPVWGVIVYIAYVPMTYFIDTLDVPPAPPPQAGRSVGP